MLYAQGGKQGDYIAAFDGNFMHENHPRITCVMAATRCQVGIHVMMLYNPNTFSDNFRWLNT